MAAGLKVTSRPFSVRYCVVTAASPFRSNVCIKKMTKRQYELEFVAGEFGIVGFLQRDAHAERLAIDEPVAERILAIARFFDIQVQLREQICGERLKALPIPVSDEDHSNMLSPPLGWPRVLRRYPARR